MDLINLLDGIENRKGRPIQKPEAGIGKPQVGLDVLGQDRENRAI